MSLSKICPEFRLRLTLILLAGALAACSSNPYAGGDGYSASAPVASSSQAGGRSASAPMAQTEYKPRLEKVTGPVPLADGHPNEYVVKPGDTLWDIAGTFLKDPWFWPEIWYVNPDIENPHLIYPGDVLGLVYIDGKPRIMNIRASTYRMSPQARITPLADAVVSIPYESVASFLSSGVVLEKGEAERLPYLLSTRGEHLIASAGNEIYVRGMGQQSLGSQFNLVHVGEPLVDPDDNRLIGYQGHLIGEGRLRRSGDPATVALTDSVREAIAGDKLIPASIDVPLNFFPSAPSRSIEGRIISVVGGVTQIGQYQVVVLNRGTDNGLAVGDVLSVYQAGDRIKDRFGGGSVKLPDEKAGTIMVFKSYDRISYGLVMEATQVIHVLDAVRNPS
ncbi:MAG: LysM peptidoglycan-binding domain-containing protein [Gammaproteobacteria bacterium]|nr:LysM peptidoglycan-binding domain-containing protein [Gammaproteobacteria bacterium]